MGAGKTTLGEEVARRIGRAFVDVDREVEREAGTTVAAIFAERGEREFRALEAGRARSRLSGRDDELPQHLRRHDVRPIPHGRRRRRGAVAVAAAARGCCDEKKEDGGARYGSAL